MRKQEGENDWTPLLDFGHLECQNWDVSIFVPPHATHKARGRVAVPICVESALWPYEHHSSPLGRQ